MVAPTPTSSHPPVLSYAESAKKAQALKPTSHHSQKSLSNNPTRQLSSAPIQEPKKPPKPPPTVEATQISLSDLSLHHASTPVSPSVDSPSHTSIHESAAHNSSNRQPDPQDTPLASPVSPLPSSQPTPPKAAPVNVWNQRIQQRAQARPQQTRPPQPLPQTAPPHVPPHVPPSPQDSSSAPSGSRQPDVLNSASVQSNQVPSSPPSLNGGGASSSTSVPSTGTTPSSRREPLASPHPHPSVDDTENWPEIRERQTSTGKPHRVNNGHATVVEVRDGDEKDTDGRSPSHPGTPKKSTFPFTS